MIDSNEGLKLETSVSKSPNGGYFIILGLVVDNLILVFIF